jgi:hypothetical protein
MPWELSTARARHPQPSAASTLPPPLPTHQRESFGLHELRDALPNPMCIESTLLPPTFQTPLLRHDTKQVPATTHLPLITCSWPEPNTTYSHNQQVLTGPDGEPWLPTDPFHIYDGPTMFGPGDRNYDQADSVRESSGPDGYVGLFYKTCWTIVKDDMIGAIRDLFALRGNCWNLLNSANVTLLPKKEGAQAIVDYRPIIVMHIMSKILGKILANRLAPLMDGLVSHC